MVNKESHKEFERIVNKITKKWTSKILADIDKLKPENYTTYIIYREFILHEYIKILTCRLRMAPPSQHSEIFQRDVEYITLSLMPEFKELK